MNSIVLEEFSMPLRSRMGTQVGCSYPSKIPLVAMRFYFDGSEGKDDESDDWLTLAGFAACDVFWDDFDKKWKTMLRERYPVAPFIHMW
jgi:hypothetical protein